jgi:menaquinone-9 beta-reductase
LNAPPDVWDVAVVGAGPAGSVAAHGAARLGLRVLLVDRATFPRRKVCGCCLNPHAISALASVGLGHVTSQLSAVPLTGITMGIAERSAHVSLSGSVSLSREAFDVALIDAAVQSGATFRPGTAIRQVKRGDTTWTLRTDAGDIKAKLIVDASGLNGRLMNRSPVVAPNARIGAGVVLAGGPASYTPGTIYMAAGRGGYVGLVRLEDGRLDVAAAFDPEFVRQLDSLPQAANRILKDAGFATLPEADWRGTPALTRSVTSLAGPGWFAVGDAAGYIEPFTGEGMAWAIAGAAKLAPLLPRALAGENLQATWRREYERHIRFRQWPCRGIAALLRRPSVCVVAVRMLRTLPRLASPVITWMNRPLSQSRRDR